MLFYLQKAQRNGSDLRGLVYISQIIFMIFLDIGCNIVHTASSDYRLPIALTLCRSS